MDDVVIQTIHFNNLQPLVISRTYGIFGNEERKSRLLKERVEVVSSIAKCLKAKSSYTSLFIVLWSGMSERGEKISPS